MKIGITLSETNYANYPRWIKGDDDIDIVELSFTKNNVDDVNTCDGIVLTGGVDIKPENYTGYPNAPEVFNTIRDQFEMAVLARALELHKPVLGICRGLQLINVFKGGSLHLDNGAVKNAVHKKEINDKVHPVQIIKESQLYHIVNQGSGEVNSSHHQSINKLGAHLMAVAYSADGLIEAIESTHPEDAFLMAVQWHPERLPDQQSVFSKNIRDALIKHICNSL